MTATELKLKFVKDILNNPKLVNLIDVYGEYPEYPEDMIDERVFTWWQFKNEVLLKAKVIIGVRITFPNPAQNEAYKNFRAEFLVLCHKDLMGDVNGLDGKRISGNRLDLIGDELERMWVWDRSGTQFRMRFVSNVEDTYNDDYYARTIVLRSYTDNNTENAVKRNA